MKVAVNARAESGDLPFEHRTELLTDCTLRGKHGLGLRARVLGKIAKLLAQRGQRLRRLRPHVLIDRALVMRSEWLRPERRVISVARKGDVESADALSQKLS